MANDVTSGNNEGEPVAQTAVAADDELVLVDDKPEPRRRALQQPSIDREIVERHATRGKALLKPLSYLPARELRQAVDRADRARFILDDEAG